MELRWGLLIVGLFVVTGVYVYSRYRRNIQRSLANLSLREEPVLKDFENTPEAADPLIAAELPVETSSPVCSPETEPAKIVALRLMSREGGFAAEKLILALREAGLRHGQFGIFHRPDADDDSRPDFSVANLIEPGSFDLTRVKMDYYPGVSIFLRLPGPDNGVEVFDDMVTTSRFLAEKLGGELLDEQGSRLSIQREKYMREEVIQFQHRMK